MVSVKNARLLINGQLHENMSIVFDTQIRALHKTTPSENAFDAQGSVISPGLIDLHMHGLKGFDVEGGEDALHAIARAELPYGVTSFLASLSARPAAVMQQNLAAVDRVCSASAPNEATLLGAHLEGPFLHPDRAGALDPQSFLAPSQEALAAIMGSYAQRVRQITIAPELPGAMALIAACQKAGINVALGHTTAVPNVISEAAACGARQITHLFNGMPPLHHRTPGPACGALLEDALCAELIADGIHVAPEMILLSYKLKGSSRCVLITDAMSAAGCPDGTYSLGGTPVSVRDGVARIPAGNLAGSTLTLDKAVRNVIGWGVSPEHALAMATQTPAAQLGLQDRGILAEGACADLVLWDDDWRIRQVWKSGTAQL